MAIQEEKRRKILVLRVGGHLTWKIRFVPTVLVTQESLNINVRGTHKQTNEKRCVQRWRWWRLWWWWWTLVGVRWRLSISGCACLCITLRGEIQSSGCSHRQPQKQINQHTWDELPKDQQLRGGRINRRLLNIETTASRLWGVTAIRFVRGGRVAEIRRHDAQYCKEKGHRSTAKDTESCCLGNTHYSDFQSCKLKDKWLETGLKAQSSF